MPSSRPFAATRISLGYAAIAIAFAGGCTAPGADKSKSWSKKVKSAMQSQLSDSYHDDESDAKLARAEAMFTKGEFEPAQQIFAELAVNTYNPAAMIERSRFMEGECLRSRGRLPTAVDAYNRLLQDFPAGVYSERAAGHMYAIAEGWMKDVIADIESKEKGGRSWAQRFKLPNPSDKSKPLVDGEGELTKTLENVVNGCPTAPFADKAMFWCGYLHFIRGRFEDSDHFFSQLVEIHKDSPLRQEALKYAVMAKNNSTGGAVYDGQKSAEALQLVHHMEATDPKYIQDTDKAGWLTRQKMAIRIQQAQKDFEQAEYYKRTNHLGPAFFYYEMVMRRYPGTKYSDKAKERIVELEQVKKTRETEKATNGGKDNTKSIWERTFGLGDSSDDVDPTPNAKPRTGPTDAPPRMLPPDGIRNAQ